MNFSYSNRNELKRLLVEERFDVLVIGGGITGAGIALDAASRGMKTALVEMQDFSAGTSSRSTKLIHGGLRYLKQGDITLVAEVGWERKIVYENGPHITTPVRMMLPIYESGTFGKFSTSIGLRVYDWLAGVKKTERNKILTKEETLRREPLLKVDGLLGSGYYVEYRTDDSRLTIEVIKSAFANEARCINYTKVKKLNLMNGKILGVQVEDILTGDSYNISAKVVVNSTGPWVDEIRNMDNSCEGKTLQHTKGVHIVVDGRRFPLQQSIYFDADDGRMVFAIPREGKIYIGTTDSFYEGDLRKPLISSSDRVYLINSVNSIFPTVLLQDEDIESSWAGIRPLIMEVGKGPSEISRKDEIWESKTGLISIAGGKLTGYRKMAEGVVNIVAKKLKKLENKTYSDCVTRSLPISGGDFGGSTRFNNYIINMIELGVTKGLEKVDANYLVRKYGANTNKLYQLIPSSKELAKKYNLPLIVVVELLYGIEEEMVVLPSDYFIRRSGRLLFDIQSVELYAKNVVQLMGNIFSWDTEKKELYYQELEKNIQTASSSEDYHNNNF